MRGPVVAALLLLMAAPAAASGSSLALTGPSSVAFSDIVTIPIRAHLLLDSVICSEEALVPVTLRVTRATGADASLEVDDFFARIPAGANVEPREASATLMLRLAPTHVGAGGADVAGTFSLPSQCLAMSGPSAGDATLHISLDVRGGEQDAASVEGRPVRVVPLERGLPLPILLAGLAAATGAVAIVVQRARGLGLDGAASGRGETR